MKRRRLNRNLRVILRALVYAMMIGSLLLVGMPTREVGGTPPISGCICFGGGNDVGASTDDVRSVALGDLDRDGDLDIISGSDLGEDYEVIAWENDGSPFSDLWNSNDVGASTSAVFSVAVGDLDDDGDLDIISGSGGGEDYQVIVWENDGSPFSGLWTQNDAGTSTSWVWSVALGDLDNDGDLDIVCGSGRFEDYEVIAWENDGSPFSGLWTQNDVGASTDDVWSVALGDLDDDGDLDIVSGGGFTWLGQVIAWENDGSPFSGLWTQNDVGASTRAVFSVAVGDLDGDGHLDIVSGSQEGGEDYEVIVWENDGSPFSDLWNQNDVGDSAGWVYSVALGDLDNDGDLDIVSGGYHGGYEVIVWENDGSPFSDPWTQRDVGASYYRVWSVALGDLDDDGDLDIISGSNSTEDYEIIAWENTPPWCVCLTPPTDARSGNAGETVTYTLQVTNGGTTSDTFDVAVSGNTWTTTAPAIVGPLAAGASQNMDVTVDMPTSAAPGATDVATITVTSQGDNTQGDTSTLTTTANIIYGLTVSPATDAQSGNPGQTVSYTLQVINIGNVSDRFDVAVSGNTWTTTAPATVGPLAAGASQDVDVAVTIPTNATGGASDVATITLTSRGDNTQSATSTLTTTAKHRLFLALALKNYFRYFCDDFSDPSSGWYIGETGNVKWSYRQGEYEILLRNAGWGAAAAAPIDGLTDYSVEADMRRRGGGQCAYGLVFGLLDWDHFYLFMVEPDGRYYSLWRCDPTDCVAIVGWTGSSYINPSTATNHLKVEREGSQIAIYVNDHLLRTVNDATYAGSQGVGLYALSGPSAPVAVRFDNFCARLLGTGRVVRGIPVSPGVEMPAGRGLLPPSGP